MDNRCRAVFLCSVLVILQGGLKSLVTICSGSVDGAHLSGFYCPEGKDFIIIFGFPPLGPYFLGSLRGEVQVYPVFEHC